MDDSTFDRGDDGRTIRLELPQSVSDVISSAWTKILTILAAISIVMVIILEIQSVIAGVYNIRKASADATISQVNAKFAVDMGKYP